MKLQQLSRQASTPVSTVKYYLREGLLPPGRKLNATTSAYGSEHVDRLELIRALGQVVGLSLDRVRQVVEAVETLDTVRMMGRVQSIVLDLPAEPAGSDASTAHAAAPSDVPATDNAAVSDSPAGSDGSASSETPADSRDPGRLTARDVLEAMGWRAGTPESLLALDGQLATMAQWGLAPSLDTVLVYARAVDRVAEHELSLGAPWAAGTAAPGSAQDPDLSRPGTARGGEGQAGGDRPASGSPSADRIAAYTAIGVHGYSQLLLRLLAVAQGSHARGLDELP
ncbi:MAG: MerR family transcriptional regulator [Micrococcus sp.]|nr:MerR family transcriptional regulator [Micrococcus sp.]